MPVPSPAGLRQSARTVKGSQTTAGFAGDRFQVCDLANCSDAEHSFDIPIPSYSNAIFSERSREIVAFRCSSGDHFDAKVTNSERRRLTDVRIKSSSEVRYLCQNCSSRPVIRECFEQGSKCGARKEGRKWHQRLLPRIVCKCRPPVGRISFKNTPRTSPF
jgi:hypothetical protein